MCEQQGFPVIKWFSESDVTGQLPGVQCYRVDKVVTGQSWRTWAGWFKLLRYLDEFPF